MKDSGGQEDEVVDVLIVGAGPTGLGAATRLHQLEREGKTSGSDWLLLDAAPAAGGLACTDVTPEGFLFDMGGHVIFSHYAYFDQLLNAAVGGSGPEHWAEHKREAFVWMRGSWVPYPLQNHLEQLPEKDRAACLDGLAQANSAFEAKVAAAAGGAVAPPQSFDEWILRTQGVGLADSFMRPYNYKGMSL